MDIIILCVPKGKTGYNHCVTMGRSKMYGDLMKDNPQNPIVTSNPIESNKRHNPDHLKPKYFNPDVVVQKAGHGSYVETQLGECNTR